MQVFPAAAGHVQGLALEVVAGRVLALLGDHQQSLEPLRIADDEQRLQLRMLQSGPGELETVEDRHVHLVFLQLLGQDLAIGAVLQLAGHAGLGFQQDLDRLGQDLNHRLGRVAEQALDHSQAQHRPAAALPAACPGSRISPTIASHSSPAMPIRHSLRMNTPAAY